MDETTPQTVALSEAQVAICGENAVLPARFVGCGKPIAKWEQVYRCTHCHAPFHWECAETHFREEPVS